MGIGFSVGDYRRWRYEEIKNFGHGPTESLTPPKDLTARYENAVAGVRFAYPADWTVEPNRIFSQKNPSIPLGKQITMVRVKYPSVSLEVGMEKAAEQGTALLEGEIKRLKDSGIIFTKERDYLNTDRENWIVLTWEEGEQVVRYAITAKGERLVFVKAVVDKNVFSLWTRTVDEVIKNVTLI